MKRTIIFILLFLLFATTVDASCDHVMDAGGGLDEGMMLEQVVGGHTISVKLVETDGEEAIFKVNNILTAPLEECEIEMFDFGDVIVRIWPSVIENSYKVTYAFALGAEKLDSIYGEQLIIVGERAPTADVFTGIDLVQFLQGQGYDAPIGTAMIDTEAYKKMSFTELHKHISYVIDGEHILILMGGDVGRQSKDLALNTKNYFESEGFIVDVENNPKREDLLVDYDWDERPEPKPIPEPEPEPEPEEVFCTEEVRKCPDGSYVARDPENNCAFRECPEFIEPEPEEVTCQGCMRDERCIPYGSRLEGQRYCALDKAISAQKNDDMSCLEHYECKSNQCLNSLCQSLEKEVQETKGLIQSILNWLARIFG